MTTINDAWQAGIDAVVADNTLNRAGFVDALQTVLDRRFSNGDGNAWCDAVAAEFNRLGLINQPTYNRLRANIIDDPVAHRALFDALGTIGQLPETLPALQSAQLIDLRDERDSVNGAITRCDELIAAEPGGTVGRLVKDVLREGKRNLRGFKEQLRDQIRNITGDPDA